MRRCVLQAVVPAPLRPAAELFAGYRSHLRALGVDRIVSVTQGRLTPCNRLTSRDVAVRMGRRIGRTPWGLITWLNLRAGEHMAGKSSFAASRDLETP